MESSEEMVTPRAAAWEADEEERKAAAAEVLVECAAEADSAGSMVRKGDLFVCMGSMQTECRTASNVDVLGQMNTKFECDGAKTIFFSVQGQKSPLNGVLHLIFPKQNYR